VIEESFTPSTPLEYVITNGKTFLKNDDEWIRYHDERATFRSLCKHCNASNGCGEPRATRIP